MTNFKLGDKVRCINADGINALTKDAVYTVLRQEPAYRYHNRPGGTDRLILQELAPYSRRIRPMVTRFELVEEPATFKRGDRVRCISPKGRLTLGQIYTIDDLTDGYDENGQLDPEHYVTLRELPSIIGGWLPSRFELAPPLTPLERIQELIGRITPPARRRFRVAANEHGMVYLQVEGKVRDLTDPLNPGEKSWQRGTKAYISEHAVDSEVFQCALSLLITFDEHETREAFLVDGKRVFGPHIRTEALKSVCDDTETRH